MKRAAELLCEDKMTVQQVCEAVGIPNLGTFQKAFKREYGVAPSRYREYALRSSRCAILLYRIFGKRGCVPKKYFSF